MAGERFYCLFPSCSSLHACFGAINSFLLEKSIRPLVQVYVFLPHTERLIWRESRQGQSRRRFRPGRFRTVLIRSRVRNDVFGSLQRNALGPIVLAFCTLSRRTLKQTGREYATVSPSSAGHHRTTHPLTPPNLLIYQRFLSACEQLASPTRTENWELQPPGKPQHAPAPYLEKPFAVSRSQPASNHTSP